MSVFVNKKIEIVTYTNEISSVSMKFLKLYTNNGTKLRMNQNHLIFIYNIDHKLIIYIQ
jgi:hypothetical protein